MVRRYSDHENLVNFLGKSFFFKRENKEVVMKSAELVSIR